jgi:hypothetical protein
VNECFLGLPQVLSGQILIDDTIFPEHCGNLRTPELPVTAVAFPELNYLHRLKLIPR